MKTEHLQNGPLVQMTEINHWVKHLPEFGLPQRIVRLVDERDRIVMEISDLHKRLVAIEQEINGMVERQWCPADINEARNKFTTTNQEVA